MFKCFVAIYTIYILVKARWKHEKMVYLYYIYLKMIYTIYKYT
jgi:hypothetical protein